jgi:rubrerythrin
MSRIARRTVLQFSLAGAAACACAGLHSSFAQSDSKIYVCPPCGCSMDGKEFSEPGSCPACDMTLIPKPKASHL